MRNSRTVEFKNFCLNESVTHKVEFVSLTAVRCLNEMIFQNIETERHKFGK